MAVTKQVLSDPIATFKFEAKLETLNNISRAGEQNIVIMRRKLRTRYRDKGL